MDCLSRPIGQEALAKAAMMSSLLADKGAWRHVTQGVSGSGLPLWTGATTRCETSALVHGLVRNAAACLSGTTS